MLGARNLAIKAILFVLVLDGLLLLILVPKIGVVKDGGVAFEAVKVLLQLAAIGVTGAIVTALLGEVSKAKDRDAAKLLSQAAVLSAMNEFRRASVERLVGATNTIRRAPILIDSHQSKKTYGEQMRAILDARLELSLLRHDIESTTAFAGRPLIAVKLSEMESHLKSLLTEWSEVYSTLSATDQDWAILSKLKCLGDLRKGGEIGTEFDAKYLLPYKEALRMMRHEIFNQEGASDPAHVKAIEMRATSSAA